MNPPNPLLDPQQFPETAKFNDWHRAQKAQGLVDIKFYPANLEAATVESFCKEVNQALAAKSSDDPDLS